MDSTYRLKFSQPAKKYLKKLRKKDKHLLAKMNKAINDISSQPYDAGDMKKGDLSGVYGYDIYHNGTNYELAYKIVADDNGNLILIILAGSRENFYDELKKYLK